MQIDLHKPLVTARLLRSRWTALAAEYLPIRPQNSIWLHSRKQLRHDPSQGWKIHVSSTVLNANDILATIGPKLKADGALFKAPGSLETLMRINTGLIYGYSQIGKFITIYPRDESQLIKYMEMLEPLVTPWSSSPAVPFDLRFKKTCLYYRYGAFGSKQGAMRTEPSSIVSPAGIEVEDSRNVSPAQIAWLKDPFGGLPNASRKTKHNRLNSRYVVYGALSQRGKGGVYECLDARHNPPRQCILKEGRKNGETTWDGRDGRSRVQNEARVLASLACTGADVPRIYDRFSLDGNEYLVIERIEGVNLRTLIEGSRGRVSIQASLAIGLKLCEIMTSVHETGWLWRDCKPGNVIIDTLGKAKAIDFEGACPAKKPDPLPWSTPYFVPPELEFSSVSEPANATHDLFALGVCLFLLFDGNLPTTKGKQCPEKLRRRGVPKEIRNLISRLLSPDSLQRPDAETAAQFFRQASRK